MADETREAIERVFRDEYGMIVAAVNRSIRDLELAEDVVAESLAGAMTVWRDRGIPDRPGAWLVTTARRKAIDRLRRRKTLERKTEELATLTRLRREVEEWHPDEDVPDERLRLIFTCCHPALPMEARVALALKTLGGLTTGEVAAALLVSETAMYQRIVRAKRKVKDAGIPYEVPSADLLPERLTAVLAVVYLIFTEGYRATSGHSVDRPDLAREAIRLGRCLLELMPDEPEVGGLLALMLLHGARSDARQSPDGSLVLLADQDRKTWDVDGIQAAVALLERALRAGRPGPYQIEAAIAAVHAESPSFDDTDWKQIAALYGELVRHRPTPVVALNHAVAVSMWRGPEAGLVLLDRLGGQLDGHAMFHAARADLLRQLGRMDPARTAYLRAIDLTTNQVERRYLEARLATVEASP